MYLQFVPVFEKECWSLAAENGVEFPIGFSALELFQRMSLEGRPCAEMFSAVKALKDNG